MERRLTIAIRRASARRLAASFLLLALYAGWLFSYPSPWTTSLAAAGGTLPELQAGYPAGEPAATLERLGSARADYFWAQGYDLPFALLGALVAASAIGLALKRFRLTSGDPPYAMLLPALYVAFEFSENAMLALFASGAARPEPALALLQQTATTAKLAAGLLTALLSIAAVVSWGFALVRQAWAAP